MPAERTIVFLPCHTLDDFPTWLDEGQADDVLAAWTAAWHPCLIATTECVPSWASVDLPPPQGRLLGIVPASFDDRFTVQAVASGPSGSAWVRGVTGRQAIAAAAAREAGVTDHAADALPGAAHADDFHALGLAVLLAELLARRMRSATDLESTGFAEMIVAAARAALAGRDDEVRSGLRGCFDCLEATRARYYPVDVWAVDIVLLATTTSGAPLSMELASPVPIAVVSTGRCLESAAARHPESVQALREAVNDGRAEPCGGRDEDGPLDACTPEEILASFQRGRAAWRDLLGSEPATFARTGGGASPMVPQVLAGLGCTGAVWSLFDGTPLPDPGSSRIRWEGGGAGIEAIARPPLDARLARTVLTLPDVLGDAMDHDHTAVVQYAHYAGTAGAWHELIRRIGSWSGLLGRFVTPHDLIERTVGMGTLVSFEPDAYPPTPLPSRSDPEADPVSLAVLAARHEAQRIRAAAAPVMASLAGAAEAASPPRRPSSAAAGRRRWLPAALFGGGGDGREDLVLDNGLLRLQVHAQTGGVLSLRRPADRGNRLSQQLALRTTRPQAAVEARESPDDRGEYTSMRADTVEPGVTADGRPGIVSRGRLLDAAGAALGNFVQHAWLVPGLPLALLDLDVHVSRPLTGPAAEQYAACRFAWHENEEMEIRRSLHTQSAATDRTRFTAPHFIEVASATSRTGAAGAADAVTILTGGMPWHVRSSPHVLDTLLFVGGAKGRRRLGVAVGLERPWDAALALLSGDPGLAAAATGSANVRLTVHETVVEGERLLTARVGLLESAGRAGEIRVEWAVDIVRATVCDLSGRPRSDAGVTIEGRALVAHLGRYEWLHLDLVFNA